MRTPSAAPKSRPHGFIRAIVLVAALATAAVASIAKSGKSPDLLGILKSIASLSPTKTPQQRNAELLAAAKSGDTSAVADLLDAKTPTELENAATTPLIAAAIAHHPAVIQQLASHGADLEATDSTGKTALTHALAHPSPKSALTLLQLGASPNTTTPSGEPAIVFATRTHNTDLIRALAARHSEDSPLANLGDALAIAVANDDLTATRLLLEAGASPVPFENGGANALDIAVRAGHLAAAEMILSYHGADLLHTIAPDLLNTTVTNGHPEILESLLNHGADPDLTLTDNSPLPLDIAVRNGDLIAASRLLEHCATSGEHLAVALRNGNARLVDLLLANGADASNATVDGEPPLFAAIRSGNSDLAARLLQAGADPSATGRENQSALAVAVALRQPSIASLILDAGADPNQRLNDPVSKDYIDLIEGGDSLKYYLERDRRFTPIMISAGLADHGSIRTLLANGASRGVHTRSWKRYPVSFAFTSQDIYAQQLMLGRDPENEPPDEQRNVLISLSSQTATLFKNGEIIASTKISSGKKSTPTPTGKFVISDKHRHHTSSLYHVAMPYFQRLSGQAFGFHTGYVPNYPASHGCIRMPDKSAKNFFSLTRVGDPVTIVD